MEDQQIILAAILTVAILLLCTRGGSESEEESDEINQANEQNEENEETPEMLEKKKQDRRQYILDNIKIKEVSGVDSLRSSFPSMRSKKSLRFLEEDESNALSSRLSSLRMSKKEKSSIFRRISYFMNRDMCCAICLGEYDVGDSVCWSYNPECTHAFHTDCILEWLEKNKDCPCCRNKFVLSIGERKKLGLVDDESMNENKGSETVIEIK
mmetsp:Transcript_23659/g.28888  ORF Transcript_23659/g.28888 Transcript_23659/m.28888 type:complete len:211 (-) Transcript_23659:70-702(-)